MVRWMKERREWAVERQAEGSQEWGFPRTLYIQIKPVSITDA